MAENRRKIENFILNVEGLDGPNDQKFFFHHS